MQIHACTNVVSLEKGVRAENVLKVFKFTVGLYCAMLLDL